MIVSMSSVGRRGKEGMTVSRKKGLDKGLQYIELE